MPRNLPIGNGSLLINFDDTGQIRDIYWPHVGQENHTLGRVNRLGIWVDGSFCWLDAPHWRRSLRYSADSLVTDCTLEQPALGITLSTRDAVDFHENVLVRQITVNNSRKQAAAVRLFFCQDFCINGTTVGDSAYYEPDWRTIFHYKGRCWFLIGLLRGYHENWRSGLDQWAVGYKGVGKYEGTWRDAEDGLLSGSPVAQGSIDSVAALHLQVPANGQATGWYTLTVGSDYQEVTRIYRAVLKKGPLVLLQRTADYWRLWVNKDATGFTSLPAHLTTLYRRSLLILRTQIDNTGAIIAANDFDSTSFNRDTYSYMWPRDGALVTATLVAAGYGEISRRFFDFCHKIITDQGFLLHKYTPDGSLASSWHGWYRHGRKQLPIQEDETALVIWAMWKYFEKFKDVEVIKPHYRGLVIRAGEWLSSHIDPETGLPLPSWDLWEERYGVHAWTTAAVWAGLRAAANFAESFGEDEHAVHYRRTAHKMLTSASALLWHKKLGAFVRTLNVDNGDYQQDPIMDASVIGLWYFGMFAADDPLITKTMKAMRAKLWLKTESGGMARYENDPYYRVSEDRHQIPGNPWFICTLWLAQWHIAAAQTREELQEGLQLIEWAAAHTPESGVMAEQVHPHTNTPLSVRPLTWSHATYVAAILEYNQKALELSPT